MPQGTVAHRERVATELLQHGPHDAGAREDHLRALRLEAGDRASLVGVTPAVEPDLPVDLGPIEHRALHHVRVVLDQAVPDRGQVGDRAAHADERIGRTPAGEAPEAVVDGAEGGGERLVGDDPLEAELLGEATAPTLTLNRSSTSSASPNVNCELPPPVSKTTRDPDAGSPDVAARKASRASSSPEMTSTMTPQCASTWSTTSALLLAIRRPAVPTAAIAATPLLRGLTRHARHRCDRPLHRRRLEPPGLFEALAQPRDLGAVGERPPTPSASAR